MGEILRQAGHRARMLHFQAWFEDQFNMTMQDMIPGVPEMLVRDLYWGQFEAAHVGSEQWADRCVVRSHVATTMCYGVVLADEVAAE